MDTTIHPMVANMAPGITSLHLSLLLGVYLYKRANTSIMEVNMIAYLTIFHKDINDPEMKNFHIKNLPNASPKTNKNNVATIIKVNPIVHKIDIIITFIKDLFSFSS
ncbi:hypothetical protein SDC9_154622 [bioreactor metagenome]|uniref:Uncharacterized protein n=1 Tax=bioreactor metagenome TaxID=1076179 RepID=A0A645F103_9ZZZZ